jgi:shikimate dehydrogenase
MPHPTIDHYVVMGHPVAHSRSPWIHARFAQLTGQRMDYGRHLTPLDGFASELAALRQQGLRGCNITVPFKFDAFAAATHRTERAERAQACNTLTFDGAQVLGDNTDGVGLVRDITVNANVPLAGARVLLLGAGGAAAGVLGPLLAEQPRELVVCNRTASKAHDLVARHSDVAQQHKYELSAIDQQELDGVFDVIINATASSLSGGEVPAPAHVLRPGALAYDMMYGPAAQPFLDWARQHGALGRDGLGMLVEQAAAAFELWRGVRPPSAQVLAELSALLATPAPSAPSEAPTH